MVLTQTVNKKHKVNKCYDHIIVRKLNSGNKNITHNITNEPDICRKKNRNFYK